MRSNVGLDPIIEIIHIQRFKIRLAEFCFADIVHGIIIGRRNSLNFCHVNKVAVKEVDFRFLHFVNNDILSHGIERIFLHFFFEDHPRNEFGHLDAQIDQPPRSDPLHGKFGIARGLKGLNTFQEDN